MEQTPSQAELEMTSFMARRELTRMFIDLKMATT